ncbi:MAG: hypothetical protein Q4Q04_00635, partial [Methanocorpusculum sp.]|nr:hypothetical protein [Methanocorpusculum sp.]
MILVLAAVLLTGCIGAASAQNIGEITISGITEPVAGAMPDTKNPTIFPSNVTAGSISWKIDGGGDVSGKFGYNTVYVAEFPISVKDYDNFTTVSANDDAKVTGDDPKTRTVQMKFPKTESEPEPTEIASIKLTLTAPATGNA